MHLTIQLQKIAFEIALCINWASKEANGVWCQFQTLGCPRCPAKGGHVYSLCFSVNELDGAKRYFRSLKVRGVIFPKLQDY
jgi:hypothetical protein